MKKILILLVVGFMFFACSDSKTFDVKNENGETVQVTADPYGFANKDENKIEGVSYKPSVAGIICSVIFCETVIVPIYILGWDIMEPVGLKPLNNTVIDDGVIKKTTE